MNWTLQGLRSKFWRTLAPVKPLLEWLAEAECAIAAGWARCAHKRLLKIQWTVPPIPENFDHRIDLYYWWTASRNPQWVERGVYGALALQGGDVLELCCGDGFNARNFYSLKSRKVVACDFNPQAIRLARRKNSAPNVSYLLADIRTEMPAGRYGNIVWDAAIEHFTENEIRGIMANLKSRLGPAGILSGHTVVEEPTGLPELSHHEYEFKNKEDLLRFFTPHFANVLVFETQYPGRHNLYFWASDGVIPFGRDWPHACQVERSACEGAVMK